MRHFCIITNSDKGANAQIAQRAVQYLRAHDADCVILPNFLEETGGIRHFMHKKQMTGSSFTGAVCFCVYEFFVKGG